MSSLIRSADVRLYHIPLAEILVDAKHGDHTLFELVVVTIELEDGRTGTGYSYTGGKGGVAIAAMIETDLVPMLTGRDAEQIDELYDEMFWHIHYVGRGGISSFAISAVDIALWDLRGKITGQSLSQMAGGADTRCRAYCGGIDLNFSLPKLLDNISGYLSRGYNGVKIKVGQPELKTDIERVAAVRKLIGDDVSFMVDANYSLSVPEAIEAAHAFADYGILWFEEPIEPDLYDDYAKIATATSVPLAMGENLHTHHEFHQACSRSSLSYLQPDASNCGGITGFLRAAEIGRQHDITICSHGMQELHVSLLSGLGSSGWLEVHSFPIEHYTKRPLVIKDAHAIAPQTAGTGVEFDWELLERSNLRSSTDWRTR